MGASEVKIDPKEAQRSNKRLLRRATRQIERERGKLELSERKALEEVKAQAKKGKHEAAKIIAKEVVNVRKQINQFYIMQTQLKCLEMKLGSMEASTQIAGVISSATKTMKLTEEKLNTKEIQTVLKEFSKQTAMIDMKGEMLNDAMDAANPVDDGDADTIYKQILNEQHLEIVDETKGAVPKDPVKVGGGPVSNDVLGNLEKELQALK
jgi:division protein CdvB (Snf7/Vps24/ESCRT-III family)